MTTTAPTSSWNQRAQNAETFTVNVCARAVDGLVRRWVLVFPAVLALGALLSLRAAVQSALSALELLRQMMVSSHLPSHHVRIAASRHHAEIAKTAQLLLGGTRQLTSSMISHPAQPEVILTGAAFLAAITLASLFLRGGPGVSGPDEGEGVFGAISVCLGLFGFLVLLAVFHGVVADPLLSATHQFVGSVFNAA